MKYLSLFLFLLLSCQQSDGALSAGVTLAGTVEPSIISKQPPASTPFLNPDGTTVSTRFIPSSGFERVVNQANTFADFLQTFAVKPDGAKVYLHNGEEKYSQQYHAAVLDISTGKADLQQCADAVMRLRAEYLWGNQRFADIHFNFVNGFIADYARWRTGDRIWVKGNKTGWRSGSGETPGRAAFDQYLKQVFMFANTASLERELRPVQLSDIQIGDVLIKGGFPGHAVLVVDKSRNLDTGEVEVLLAQSYMPAQDIHILRNPARRDGNPWYKVPENGQVFRTMEWTFSGRALRRFTN